MTLLLNNTDLATDPIGLEFQGKYFADASVSFILVEAQPGMGVKLHSHPYEEIFIIQQGEATYTVGDETLHAHAGQIVVAPANVPHKFVNTGSTILRQVDIHPNREFVTAWLE